MSQTCCFTLISESMPTQWVCYIMKMDCGIQRAGQEDIKPACLSRKCSQAHRARTSQRFTKRLLQGARLPHSLLRDTSSFLVDADSSQCRKDTYNSQGKVFMRGTVPPCQEHICSLHGGLMRQPATVVPLYGDDIWNPRNSLVSPYSGLMKQPTKEGPFRNSRNV